MAGGKAALTLCALLWGLLTGSAGAATVTDTFTTSGIWVAPAGVTSATVEVWGGGGAATAVGGVPGAGGALGIGTTRFTGGNGGRGRDSNTGRGAPGGSSAGTAANGTNGSDPWTTATAAAPPAGGGIGGNGGNANFQDGFAPASGNGGGGGGGAERQTAGGNGAGGKVMITYTEPAGVSSIDCIGSCTTNAGSVSWLVTFNTSVTGVDASNFTLVNTGLGGTPAITLVTGSGTTRTVTASTGTGSGTLGLNMVNSTGVSPTLVGLPFVGQVFTIDRTVPVVSSIVRVDPTPTALSSVSWTVTFSESVTGVDTTDFTVAQAGGVSGAIVTGVSGSGSVYAVTVSTGTGNGTLGLNLADNDSIVDVAGNALGGTGAGNGDFAGEIYTVDRPLTATASPTLCVNDAGIGTQSWSTLTGPVASDDSHATATVNDGQVTNFLKCTGYNFAIPAGAVISGIVVSVERNASNTNVRDAAMRVVKGGVIGTTDRATTTLYPNGTDAVEDHGGASDLWGTTWTATDINAADFGAALASQKSNNAGGNRTVRVDHMTITVHYTVPVLSPGDFNAFETSTSANAVTGQIFTKLAGIDFSLDVVAINAGAQLATFTDVVDVDLVTGASGGLNCPGTPVTVAGSSQNVSLVSGRGTTAALNAATAYSSVRVRIRYPVGSPTITSCSTDTFSLRPQSFTVTSSDANNSGFGAGTTIKTGANFNLTATAVAGYDGTPAIDNTQIAGTPNAGTIGGSFTAAPIGTGIATGNSFYYSEVGNFGLNADAVRDTTFTNVDQGAGDCIAASTSNVLSGNKYGCWVGSAAVPQTTGSSGFGRFIPDNFNVSYNAPVLTPACGGFSYIGQSFNYSTAPVITVTARNGTNNGLTNQTTLNYAGNYAKLTNTSLAQGLYAAQSGRYTWFDALGGGNTPVLDVTGLPGTGSDPTIGAFAGGVATLTFSGGTAGFTFTRDATTPSVAFDADIALALDVIDTDGVTFAGNPAGFGSATAGNGMLFSDLNAGTTNDKQMRYGRLQLSAYSGSPLLKAEMPMQAQYWGGSFWLANTDDNCTALSAVNVGLGNYQGNLNAGDSTVTGVTSPLTSGRGFITLSAPGGANNGGVDVAVNLGPVPPGTTTADACPTFTPSATAANLQHLRGQWCGATATKDPSARARFGVRGGGSTIYRRETY